MFEPWFGEEENHNVQDALKRGVISGTISADYTGEFERQLATSCGVEHAVTTTSGTTALALAVAALGLKQGDEVLVQSLTNIATAFAVLYAGAKPVFLDSEKTTWNVDPAMIEAKITKRTKAIIVVHLYGHPVDMDPVMDIARRHNLFVIEDAAEAHGAEYKGKRMGGVGNVGCLSFYINKVVTTGEGGALVTHDATLAGRARMLKNLAYSNRDKYLHNDVGFNFRLTNLQAAVGVGQMSRFDEVIRKKRQLAEMYTARLRHIPALQLPVEMPWAKNVYWMYSVVPAGPKADRDAIRSRLTSAGIETRNFFHPMHRQPIFERLGLGSPEGSLPVCEWLGKRGFYLPSSPLLPPATVDFVCAELEKALAHP